MNISRISAVLHMTCIAIVATPALAVPSRGGQCPDAVTIAVAKANPDATVGACHAEKEKRTTQYVVMVTTKDKRSLEVDVAADGRILQTEETISPGAVPAAVVSAFQEKYSGAKISKAVKQTDADGKVSYEVAFHSGKGTKEVTLGEDGAILEEE